MNQPLTHELEALQGALQFNTELTAASTKSILAGHAMVRAEMYMISVEDIRVLPDFNPRIKDAAYHSHIRSIADSIKEDGFKLDKPIAGYGALDGKKSVIYVTDGHCRLEAVKLAIEEGAPILDVPLVLSEKSTSMEDLTVSLVQANGGKRLSPPELAVVCKRLRCFNWSPAKIAEKLSMTSEYVNQLLTLAGAPSAIREMVQQGEATAAVALGAMREHGDQAGAVLGEALKVAKASGKAKLTKKFMPEQVYKSTLNKSAPKMFDALKEVQANAAYATLPEALKTLIAELVETVKKAAAPDAAGIEPIAGNEADGENAEQDAEPTLVA
jgi:ParB family chromosome partitioning protein